jgi:hypothetical protein
METITNLIKTIGTELNKFYTGSVMTQKLPYTQKDGTACSEM